MPAFLALIQRETPKACAAGNDTALENIGRFDSGRCLRAVSCTHRFCARNTQEKESHEPPSVDAVIAIAEDLKQVLSAKQEATAVLMGLVAVFLLQSYLGGQQRAAQGQVVAGGMVALLGLNLLMSGKGTPSRSVVQGASNREAARPRRAGAALTPRSSWESPAATSSASCQA